MISHQIQDLVAITFIIVINLSNLRHDQYTQIKKKLNILTNTTKLQAQELEKA